MTPISYYQNQCQNGAVIEDNHQVVVLKLLTDLSHRLQNEKRKRSRLLSLMRRPHAVRGLYLWGGVGIGKTFLMDCFYQSLPFKQKKRFHFHAFMQMVHHELKALQGKEDPLRFLAEKIAAEYVVLCFDELVISDITDAMILARLFKMLFDCGVCLVITSNLKPDDLYKNGLQRQHFLPAIALLKAKTQVYHLASTEDYRRRHLKNAGVFHVPNDTHAAQQMEKTFEILATDEVSINTSIDICHRKIPVKKEACNIVWFDFNVICAIPRSPHDYLEIAKKYHTVLISDVPVIKPEARDKISLFIRLIDVFYDSRTRLVLSAETAMEKLYTDGQYVFEYARACSRLVEMQSEHYFL